MGAPAVAACVLCVVGAAAASDGVREPHGRVWLTFGVDVPRLTDEVSIRRWVAVDLHRQLDLGDAEGLAVGLSRPLGRHRVVSLSQTAHDVPVVYRESRLVLNEDGRPVRLLGYHSPFNNTPPPHPRLSVGQAASVAGGRERVWSARLVFLPVGVELRLSYELEGVFPAGRRTAGPPERVYVDASTGEVLDRLPLTNPALDRQIHDFALACERAGIRGLVGHETRLRLFADAPVVRSETVNRSGELAERLFDLLGSIYAFLSLVLEMDSFDGYGASIRVMFGVQYHTGMWGQQCIGNTFNASWNSSLNIMMLPYSTLETPEIVMHEMTHGLVSNGSRLIYRDQSGALNESIADSIGVTFAAWLDRGMPERADADLGMSAEDWNLRFPGGAPMRDLTNPGRLGHPDHHGAYVANGDVHVNSSIINHAFYLLAEGGQHRRGGRRSKESGRCGRRASSATPGHCCWSRTRTSRTRGLPSRTRRSGFTGRIRESG